MNNYLIVETDRNLIRDLNSNAIVNKNKSEYDQFLKISEQKYKEKKEFEILKNEVKSIKNDLGEIKSLLTFIANKWIINNLRKNLSESSNDCICQ